MVESNNTQVPNQVDKKDGHIQIPNKLWDAYCGFRIPGEVRQVIDTVIRKTYGWHKQEDQISLDQFVEITGLKKPHIIRAKKMAIIHKLITQKGNGSLSLNKDPGEWIPFTRSVARNGNREATVAKKGNSTVLPKRVISVAKKGKKPLPEMVPTKDNIKDTIKDSIPAGAGPTISKDHFIARMKHELDYLEIKMDTIPNPAREVKFIRKMLARGFTEDKIFNTWSLKVINLHGEFISMSYVDGIIGSGNAKHQQLGFDKQYHEPPE